MRRVITVLLAVSPLLLPACSTSTEGEAGVLSFSHTDPDGIFGDSLDAPIATGATAAIVLRPADGGDPLTPSAATSDTPSVATARVAGDRLLVTGVAPGEAVIEVTTASGTDRATIYVADGLAHLTSHFDRVVQGGTESIQVRWVDAEGSQLAGEARAEATFEPAEAAERLDGPDHRVVAHYLEVGEMRVRTDGGTLTREVIGADAVDTFELIQTEGEAPEGTIDGAELFGWRALDAAGDELGALLGAVSLEVADETICTAEAGDVLGVTGFVLRFHAEGACRVTLRLGTHEVIVDRVVAE